MGELSGLALGSVHLAHCLSPCVGLLKISVLASVVWSLDRGSLAKMGAPGHSPNGHVKSFPSEVMPPPQGVVRGRTWWVHV